VGLVLFGVGSRVVAQTRETAETPSEDAEDAEGAEDAPRDVKVAVVSVGDPDDALRTRTRSVEDALAAEGSLVLPGDPGIRGALRGEPGSEDDGLDRVRSERRRLGLDDDEDALVLARLGRLTGSVAVVAVRREGDGLALSVLDVSEHRFYDGDLALDGAAPDAIVAYVTRRARASARRAAAPLATRHESAEEASARERAGAERPRERERHDGSESAGGHGAEARDARGRDRREPPEKKNEVLAFFEEAWPYFAAGILLAGLVVWVALKDDTPEAAVPVLRFVPGGR
jgi:hypothetical protein